MSAMWLFLLLLLLSKLVFLLLQDDSKHCGGLDLFRRCSIPMWFRCHLLSNAPQLLPCCCCCHLFSVQRRPLWRGSCDTAGSRMLQCCCCCCTPDWRICHLKTHPSRIAKFWSAVLHTTAHLRFFPLFLLFQPVQPRCSVPQSASGWLSSKPALTRQCMRHEAVIFTS